MARVCHVRLDEPGGGQSYVAFLMERPPAGHDLMEFVAARSWRSILRLRREIAKNDVDILHAHGLPAAALVFVAALGTGARSVVTLHGLHFIHRPRRWRPILLVVARVLLRRFSDVLVLSNDDVEALARHRIATPRAIHVVGTLVGPRRRMDRTDSQAQLGYGHGEFLVAWIGRLAEEKDPFTFVRAIAACEGTPIRGILAGDGPHLDAVRELTSRLSASIDIRGWLTDPSVVLAASDAFVNTSLWEGRSIATVEAATFGLPLVLSDVPGNRSLAALGGSTLTFPSGDAASLAGILKRLVHDRELRESESRRALQAAEALGQQDPNADHRAIYDQMMGLV